MRVLNVLPGLGARAGGSAIMVVEAAVALRDQGVETTTFATDVAGAASASRYRRATPADLPAGSESVDVRLFPARRPHRLTFSPELYRALGREVRRFDVVHIHSLFLFPQFAAYRQALRQGVPYVVSPHGSLDPVLRRRGRARKALVDVLWQRDLLARARVLHVTTHDEARLIADIAPSVGRSVIPSGVRVGDYQRLPESADFRRRFLGGHEGPIVLTLGRLSYKKGLDVLVRAFAKLAPEEPSARLVIAGPDDEGLQPGLERIAEAEGVGERVSFPGMLRGDDKLGALAAADVWALSSHTENFGIAVVEALAAGRACVISRHINISGEALAAGAAVVCETDASEFAAAIAALLADVERRRELGGRARDFAARYDWAYVAPQLRQMYERVAEGS